MNGFKILSDIVPVDPALARRLTAALKSLEPEDIDSLYDSYARAMKRSDLTPSSAEDAARIAASLRVPLNLEDLMVNAGDDFLMPTLRRYYARYRRTSAAHPELDEAERLRQWVMRGATQGPLALLTALLGQGFRRASKAAADRARPVLTSSIMRPEELTAAREAQFWDAIKPYRRGRVGEEVADRIDKRLPVLSDPTFNPNLINDGDFRNAKGLLAELYSLGQQLNLVQQLRRQHDNHALELYSGITASIVTATGKRQFVEFTDNIIGSITNGTLQIVALIEVKGWSNLMKGVQRARSQLFEWLEGTVQPRTVSGGKVSKGTEIMLGHRVRERQILPAIRRGESIRERTFEFDPTGQARRRVQGIFQSDKNILTLGTKRRGNQGFEVQVPGQSYLKIDFDNTQYRTVGKKTLSTLDDITSSELDYLVASLFRHRGRF